MPTRRVGVLRYAGQTRVIIFTHYTHPRPSAQRTRRFDLCFYIFFKYFCFSSTNFFFRIRSHAPDDGLGGISVEILRDGRFPCRSPPYSVYCRRIRHATHTVDSALDVPRKRYKRREKRFRYGRASRSSHEFLVNKSRTPGLGRSVERRTDGTSNVRGVRRKKTDLYRTACLHVGLFERFPYKKPFSISKSTNREQVDVCSRAQLVFFQQLFHLNPELLLKQVWNDFMFSTTWYFFHQNDFFTPKG